MSTLTTGTYSQSCNKITELKRPLLSCDNH